MMLTLTLLLIKGCNLLKRRLLNFSFLGANVNLITTNFVSSNNLFGINNYSFSVIESEKSVIDEIMGKEIIMFDAIEVAKHNYTNTKAQVQK